VTAKRLELLHELVPSASSIALLTNPADALLAEAPHEQSPLPTIGAFIAAPPQKRDARRHQTGASALRLAKQGDVSRPDRNRSQHRPGPPNLAAPRLRSASTARRNAAPACLPSSMQHRSLQLVYGPSGVRSNHF
jgi:hypothetical protein